MSKHAVTVSQRAPSAQADRPPAEADGPVFPFPFIRFGFAYIELTADGDKTQIWGRSVRVEDGKVVGESFDAELGPDVLAQLLRAAQEQLARQVASQMRWLLQPFTWFLPAAYRPPERED